jgi:putative ABC transport system substrate-binding protein
MNRREFLALPMAVFATSSAIAQQLGRIYRIAIVSTGTLNAVVAQSLPELARLGFVEGHNLSVTMRAGVPPDELAGVAQELVAKRPDLVIAVSATVVRAFADATKTIPILMSFTNDPVAEGFVTNFTRPGGNLTGQALRSTEQNAKRIELLRQAIPTARHIALLHSGTDSNVLQVVEARKVGEQIGVRIVSAEARSSEDYETAFSTAKAAGAKALVVASDPRLARDVAVISQLALAASLPTVCEWDYMARSGCLFSFGPDNDELRRRSGQLAALILKGASPADLPIEGPDRFELVINLRTARKIGVEFPATFLARADEVIE